MKKIHFHISILSISILFLAAGITLFLYENSSASPCETADMACSARCIDTPAEFCKPLPVKKTRAVLVKFKNKARVKDAVTKHGIKATDTYKLNKLGWYLIETNCENEKCREDKVSDLKKDPEFTSVQPEFSYEPTVTPNDSGFSNQWAPSKIGAPSAWGITTGKTGTIIAVIDTGIALNHEDLSGKIYRNTGEIAGNGLDDDSNGYIDDVNGWDFVHNDNDPKAGQDCLADSNKCAYAGHGTLTSSTAAAASNNGKGIAGINWQAKVMPVQVLSDAGSGSTSEVANGIIYAADNGAVVINLSLGTTGNDSAMKDSIDYAYSKGVVLVAASGNAGTEFVYYPAHYDNVIAVGASDENDARASFSSYGAQLDVVAPGTSIYSAYWTRANQTTGYAYAYGTSLATPHVAGLAALIKGESSSMTPLEVQQRIQSATNKVSGMSGANWTKYYGYGRINAYKSIAPKLSVTSYSLSKSNPLAGETISITLGIKNVGGSDIHINGYGVAVRDPAGVAVNFEEETVNADLAPNQTMTTTKSKAFSKPGTYRYYAYAYTDAGGFVLTSPRYFTVSPITSAVKLVSYGMSNGYLVAGEEVQSVVVLKNVTQTPITLRKVGMAARNSSGQVLNFPETTSFTIAPGETKNVRTTRYFPKSEQINIYPYYYFENFGYRLASNVYYNVGATTTKLQLKQLSISPSTPKVGENVTATLVLINSAKGNIVLASAGVGVNDTQNVSWNFPATTNLTIPVGELQITGTRTFSNATSYRMYGYYYVASKGYVPPVSSLAQGISQNRIDFTVTNP